MTYIFGYLRFVYVIYNFIVHGGNFINISTFINGRVITSVSFFFSFFFFHLCITLRIRLSYRYITSNKIREWTSQEGLKIHHPALLS